MDIHELLRPIGVMESLAANSKKQVLEDMAVVAAGETGLEQRVIFDTLMERERLGTTGVGNGVAIPHGRIAGLEQLSAVFARLDHPVDFESLDDQPVDLVFLLLAPEEAGADHLKALALIARLMRDEDTCRKLRGTNKADSLYALLSSVSENQAA